MVPPRSMSKKVAKKAPKRGRPPKPPGERRDVNTRLRLRPDEWRAIADAAEAAGETITGFMVAAALARAAKMRVTKN